VVLAGLQQTHPPLLQRLLATHRCSWVTNCLLFFLILLPTALATPRQPVTLTSNGQDSGTQTVFGDDNWNIRTVFDNALSALLPTPANDAIGSLNYTLAIVGSSSTFKNVQIDGSTAGSGNTVIKSIIPPAVALILINGGISNANIDGIFPDVTDTYRVTDTGGLNGFNNGYTQSCIPPVPGPLPLMGAGMALGFCRKLRSRIKGSAKA